MGHPDKFLVFALALSVSSPAFAEPPSPFICAPGTEPHVCEMLMALHDAEIDKFNARGDNVLLQQKAAKTAAWWTQYIAGLPPGAALEDHLGAACAWRGAMPKPLAELCAWWRDLKKPPPLPPPRNTS